MKITAKVVKILQEQSGISKMTGQPWRKASYVVEERIGTRANTLMVDVMDGQQNRIDRLGLQEGQVYEFFLDADAREYQGRYYNTIVCWDARVAEDPKEVPTE